MSIRPDTWIKRMALEQEMIKPFEPQQVRNGNISYGLSSYGYDIRIADEFKVFKGSCAQSVVDPKKIDPILFRDVKGAFCIIPSNSFILARSLEYFKIPRNILCLCTGKSTYARIGVVVNVTPLEPCWEGYITMEISNTSPAPVKVYANEGIAQVLFFESDETCEVSYSDRKGRYQAQKDITLPKYFL
ncbi:MAG: dCTP deaminase [Candidatus Omnitrophica bacterium]|nr:dCTP deaminase [Candidatus Omnitrophota bacterium]MBU1933455.1 dCTP deaminase [Candidatus Omnitrophota bacterium]